MDEYKRSIEIRDFYGHAMALYLEGLLLFMRVGSQIGQQKVDRFFDICKLLDLDHFSQKYKDYFDRLINREGLTGKFMAAIKMFDLLFYFGMTFLLLLRNKNSSCFSYFID